MLRAPDENTMAEPNRIVHVTKLAVIESLGEIDGNTGEQLAQDMRDELREAGTSPVVHVYRCPGADTFRQTVSQLTGEAEREEHLPILHIECHGDDIEGLTFADGTTLGWMDLTDILRPLNKATEGGLIVTVAACFGIGAIRGLDLTQPAPFYALIGPSQKIWGSELSRSLKAFYLDLIARTGAEEAAQKLIDTRLEHGHFVVVTGRLLFREIMIRYVRKNTSPSARKEQALRQHRQARAEGMNLGLTYWKRHYMRTMPGLVQQYHKCFFMLDQFPQHAPHFSATMREVEQELERPSLS